MKIFTNAKYREITEAHESELAWMMSNLKIANAERKFAQDERGRLLTSRNYFLEQYQIGRADNFTLRRQLEQETVNTVANQNLAADRYIEIARLNREVAALTTEVAKLKAELNAARADEALDSFDESECLCNCPDCADGVITEADALEADELLEQLTWADLFGVRFVFSEAS